MTMTALLASVRAAAPAVRLGIALAVIALAGTGGVLLLVVPARARAVALEARHLALQTEIAQGRTAATLLAGYRRQRAEMAQRLVAFRGKLPAEGDIAALYRDTYDAAASTGLAVSLFQPHDPRPLESYAEIPISITAEGTYHQLGTFLARLSSFSRLVTVSALKLSRLDRPGASLRAELTVTTYVYRPAGAQPVPKPAPVAPAARPIAAAPAERATGSGGVAGGPSAPSANMAGEPPPSAGRAYASRGRRDPFAPVGTLETDGRRPPGHRRLAVASATLTGIVRGPQGPLALVETPDGSGHVLRPGDGLDEARLLRIEADAVVFEIPRGPDLASERIVLALGQVK
jgi:type IV pilus assembly protein PilO